MSYVGTTALLGNAAVYTSQDLMTNTEDRILGIVKSDQSGTLHVEQGYPDVDGGTVTWTLDTTIAVTGGTGAAISVEAVAPKWRLRYVNGATPQGTFILNARTASAGNS